MIHIVIPEGLNRLCYEVPLSDYYEACLRRVGELAAGGETVYLAPGNPFGHAAPEDEIAAGFINELRPDLITHHVGDQRGRGYLDTLDNAVCLRDWARRRGCWPMGECRLYCQRYHALRTRLCFRIAGYRVRGVVASAPAKRSGRIVPRLKYYDYPAANVVYEALAIGYTLLRLAGNIVRTGSLLPALEVTS
ncbi:MAG TPA: hypothetical protein VLY24_28005 [Bryobacteraceae bacterium]|nr:hypothetical protein [Bryobacteraceae bacterium]